MAKKSNKKPRCISGRKLAACGYTVTSAARAVGVSQTHLVEVLKGNRKASGQLCEKLLALPRFAPVKCRVSY